MIRLTVTFLFLLITCVRLPSQTLHDSSKTILKNIKDKKTEINTIKKNAEPELLNRYNFQNENFIIPLNLKIYQKIITNDYRQHRSLTPKEKESGMTEEELLTFDRNKEQTEKMLSDIYGKDLIDLKKILEKLGVTKEQIIALAAILKFLFYSPPR